LRPKPSSKSAKKLHHVASFHLAVNEQIGADFLLHGDDLTGRLQLQLMQLSVTDFAPADTEGGLAASKWV